MTFLEVPKYEKFFFPLKGGANIFFSIPKLFPLADYKFSKIPLLYFTELIVIMVTTNNSDEELSIKIIVAN